MVHAYKVQELDVIAEEVGTWSTWWLGGWKLHGSQVSGHVSVDMSLHFPHADAASLVYYPTFRCRPVMNEMKQDAPVPGGYMQVLLV